MFDVTRIFLKTNLVCVRAYAVHDEYTNNKEREKRKTVRGRKEQKSSPKFDHIVKIVKNNYTNHLLVTVATEIGKWAIIVVLAKIKRIKMTSHKNRKSKFTAENTTFFSTKSIDFYFRLNAIEQLTDVSIGK